VSDLLIESWLNDGLLTLRIVEPLYTVDLLASCVEKAIRGMTLHEAETIHIIELEFVGGSK